MKQNTVFNDFVKEVYNVFKERKYTHKENTPFGVIVTSNFIGRIYYGNMSPTFSDINDIDRFLEGIIPHMLYLRSTLDYSDVQVYADEYQGHRFEDKYLIIQMKSCAKLENEIKILIDKSNGS